MKIKKNFYEAVAECEAKCYTLIPESFSSYPLEVNMHIIHV